MISSHSLGTSQIHLAELSKDGKQYDMVDRVGVKVRRSGPPFGGDVVVFNIATDRQRGLEISNRPGIARYGFRYKIAPRTPLTGQGEPETIFARELSVVGIDSISARADCQGSVNFAPEKIM